MEDDRPDEKSKKKRKKKLPIEHLDLTKKLHDRKQQIRDQQTFDDIAKGRTSGPSLESDLDFEITK